jgi:hypothetical protein
LQVNCLDNELRDEYVENVFLQDLYLSRKINYYNIDSREEKDLPHWRALIVKDIDTGNIINILPNGGFANGWKFDNREAPTRAYYPNNCDLDTEIPIRIDDPNGLLYDIKVGELL